MMAFRLMTTLLTYGTDDGEEDLSVALSHGSRGAGNTAGRGDAHVQDNVEREPPFKKQKSTDEGTVFHPFAGPLF